LRRCVADTVFKVRQNVGLMALDHSGFFLDGIQLASYGPGIPLLAMAFGTTCVAVVPEVSEQHFNGSRGGGVAYLDDAALPIDNNRAENSIRPFVIDRKNWLYASSQSGASASANFYSLIETAKANGLEPYTYLKQVYTLLPRAKSLPEIGALLP